MCELYAYLYLIITWDINRQGSYLRKMCALLAYIHLSFRLFHRLKLSLVHCNRVFLPQPHSVRSANTVLIVYQN